MSHVAENPMKIDWLQAVDDLAKQQKHKGNFSF